MDLTGQRRIPASAQRVWIALNDPQVLHACLPGCVMMDRVSDRQMNGVIEHRFGAVPARLAGTITTADLDAGHGGGFLIEARDRTAGPVSVQIGFSLAEEGGFTVLQYRVTGSAGGQFAHVSPGVAQTVLHDFLDRFTNEVASPDEILASGAAGMVAASANSSAHQHNAPALLTAFAALPTEIGGFPIIFWLGSAAFLVIFFLVFSAYL